MTNSISSKCLFCSQPSIIYEGLCDMCKFYRYTRIRKQKKLKSKGIKKHIYGIEIK